MVLNSDMLTSNVKIVIATNLVSNGLGFHRSSRRRIFVQLTRSVVWKII